MAFKQADVERWIATHAPGEALIAYTPAVMRGATSFNAGTHSSSPSITVTPGRQSGDQRRTELATSLGFDPDARVGFLVENVFYALTDRQLLFGTRSSLRDRPKDLLAAAPRGQVRVHWFDDDDTTNHFRHLVVDFGDGSYRTDKVGLKLLGRETKAAELSTAMLEALGDQAIEA